LPLDIVTFLLVVGAIGVGLLIGKARLHTRLWLPLIFMIIIYCIIPTRLFGSYYADRRLIPALFLIVACSLEWNVRPRFLMAAIALVFLVRTAIVIKNWSAAQPVYKANLEVIEQIPRGAKIAAAVGMVEYPLLNNPPIGHFPNMAVVKRDVLINSLFTGYGYQPLRIKPEYKNELIQHELQHEYYADVCSPLGDHPSAVDRIKKAINVCNAHSNLRKPVITLNPFERTPIAGFDYVLIVNKRYFTSPVPDILRPVYSAADTVLYQVIR